MPKWSYDSTLFSKKEPQLTVNERYDIYIGDNRDTLVHVTLSEPKNVERVVLKDVSYAVPEDGIVKMNATLGTSTSRYYATLGLVFKRPYLEAQPREGWSKGFYYPPCDCCCEEADMPSAEWPDDDERYEKREEYTRYTVSVPLVMALFEGGDDTRAAGYNPNMW